MSNILGKKERYILVQTDAQNKERVVYMDEYYGTFNVTESIAAAKDFNDFDEAKKVCDGMNMLYQLTKQPFNIKVVHEITERNVVEESKEEEEGSQSKSEG